VGFFAAVGAVLRVFVVDTLCNFSILQKAFFVEDSGNTGNSFGQHESSIFCQSQRIQTRHLEAGDSGGCFGK
jgi:hypothetical protein